MKKLVLLIVILFSIESFLLAQSEIHLSAGIETSFIFPMNTYVNSTGTKPGPRLQLSYQHVFNHVGFMISYEKVKREIVLNDNIINRDIKVENGQSNSNRIMFYCVGRIKANPKLIFDARVGLGKLLETSTKYYTNSAYSTAFMNIIPGLSMSWAIKTQYKFSNYIGAFIDAAYTLTPYSYSGYNDFFWVQTKQIRSGYLSNLSLSIGLAFSFKK